MTLLSLLHGDAPGRRATSSKKTSTHSEDVERRMPHSAWTTDLRMLEIVVRGSVQSPDASTLPEFMSTSILSIISHEVAFFSLEGFSFPSKSAIWDDSIAGKSNLQTTYEQFQLNYWQEYSTNMLMIYRFAACLRMF